MYIFVKYWDKIYLVIREFKIKQIAMNNSLCKKTNGLMAKS